MNGELKGLMPFGLLGRYDDDLPGFKREYFARLDRVGVGRIRRQLTELAQKALNRMAGKGDVTGKNLWQGLEYLCADYLSGE